MEIFADSADLAAIAELAAMGIIDGVTTNPSLLAKASLEPIKVLESITQIVRGPVSAEVISCNADEMFQEALELSKIAPNIVIKLPLISTSILVGKNLANLGIPTNFTLCFSVPQAIFAAKAGATYVSPFIGRLDDIGQSGMALIQDIHQVFNNYQFPTKILAASIRSVSHIYEAARIGAHAVTAPINIIYQMFQHPLTEQGLNKFLHDWHSLKR